jgi:hypothetical protein
MRREHARETNKLPGLEPALARLVIVIEQHNDVFGVTYVESVPARQLQRRLQDPKLFVDRRAPYVAPRFGNVPRGVVLRPSCPLGETRIHVSKNRRMIDLRGSLGQKASQVLSLDVEVFEGPFRASVPRE